jgi:AcrR family transcriptional regulator
MATLRDDGLVDTKIGAGTVVSTLTGPTQPVGPTMSPTPQRSGALKQALNRKRTLRTAIAIADTEGLDAVSMRRLAAELGVGPMSLYRHVSSKDELVTQMADEVFGEPELPVPGPEGWRAKLELISRMQWELCRRHLWLPRAISFIRPLLVPNMMAHTEWTLRALDGLGLPMTTRIREALTLHALVLTVALSMADEVEAEQETGVTLDRWWLTQRKRADELLQSGRFPLLATVTGEEVSDVDGLFEYSLARHLDGFATLVQDQARTRP